MQVAENGDLANRVIPGKRVKGNGRRMDLVTGVRRVVVLIEHVASDGSAKLLRSCSLPLTGQAVVHQVITDLCVMDVTGDSGAGRTTHNTRARSGGATYRTYDIPHPVDEQRMFG